MYYSRKKLISALGVLTFGTFVITAILLPRETGVIHYTNAIGGFVASRTDWHIAWCVLLGTLTVSITFFLILEAFSENKHTNEHRGPGDAAARPD